MAGQIWPFQAVTVLAVSGSALGDFSMRAQIWKDGLPSDSTALFKSVFGQGMCPGGPPEVDTFLQISAIWWVFWEKCHKVPHTSSFRVLLF